jgi:hypothetical protein
MHVRVEEVTSDKTQIYFIEASGEEHWRIDVQTAPNGRAYYTVTNDGWVVCEMTAREVRETHSGLIASECFITRGRRACIPAEVLSHLPKEC